MKLSDEQKALLRHCLIAQVCAAGRVGMPRASLLQGAKLAGFRIEADDLDTHLDALVTKGLFECQGQAVSMSLKRWFPTKDGLNYAEENGLV